MLAEELLRFDIIQMEDVDMPGTASGDMLLSPTSGGTFAGERLKGTLLPVGLGVTRTRGTENDIHSETLLRTDDGADILMTMDAFFDVDPQTEARLIAGEPVDPNAYYYRGTVRFETGAARYKWLERRICVCQCEIEDYTRIEVTVYMIS